MGIDLYNRDDRWKFAFDFSVIMFDEDDVIARRLLSIDLSNSRRLESFDGTFRESNCRDRCS